MAATTVQQALQNARADLKDVSDAPDIDTERLLLFILKKPNTTWIYTHLSTSLSGKELADFKAAVTQRATGKPLAYILGEAEFFGRSFKVSPDVLIPRPETEELVARTLELTQLRKPITIADIGTGSGCIGITLALELPKSIHIIATDISPAALQIARQNAKRHKVENRIEFIKGNMLESLVDHNVDLIVSNPPYVPSDEIAQAGDTRDTRGLMFEPHLALDGGLDGQIYIDVIKKSGIPAIIEGTGGKVSLINI